MHIKFKNNLSKNKKLPVKGELNIMISAVFLKKAS